MRWQLSWLAGLALAEIVGLFGILIWLGAAGVRGGYVLIGVSIAALVVYFLFMLFEGITPPMSAFKVGDLVRLRNPWAPVMTVVGLADTRLDLPPIIEVCWFGANSSLHRDVFGAEVLEMAPPE